MVVPVTKDHRYRVRLPTANVDKTLARLTNLARALGMRRTAAALEREQYSRAHPWGHRWSVHRRDWV